ncbi:cysteine hydrolase family protein [Leucobacter sp. HY1910]
MAEIEQAALVVVDMQQGFLDGSWGQTANYPQCEHNVERLIQTWTELNLPVVIVRHDSVNPASSLYVDGPGNALMPLVAHVRPDLVVSKTVNSSFYGTPDLEAWLRSAGIAKIVVCGIQTNLCVETTARMGGNLGFEVVVPLDATRTFDLAGPDGTVIDAVTLARVTATNLHGDGFARVVSTGDLLAEMNTSES